MSDAVTVIIDEKPVKALKDEKLKSLLSMDFPCGGNGKCGKCKVKVVGNALSYTESEKLLLTEQEIKDGIHLACSIRVFDGLNIATMQKKSHTGTVISHSELLNVECKPDFSMYGVAIDIGTTTLAARLYDNFGRLLGTATGFNPQSSYGADVISRIKASLDGEDKRLTSTIVTAIDGLINELSLNTGIDTKTIEKIVITGNTTMLSILTSTSVEPLSHAPFCAKRLFDEYFTAENIGLLSVRTDTKVYLPRCISAFIGADVFTAIIASGILNNKETQLLIDIGTNGEIALWHNERLYFCSTAAGPAFEGGGIYMGMPGKSGAIDRVELIDGEILVHTIDEIEAQGICGSGIIDAVAVLLKKEEIDESGYMEDDSVSLTSSVCFTQKDVRAVQLSKSAIYSGISALLNYVGIGYDAVEKMYIAGGFGSYVNIKNAAKIGLLPKELTDKISVIGNAALGGASVILLNNEYHQQALKCLENSAVIDLSTDAYFVDKYVENMMFY